MTAPTPTPADVARLVEAASDVVGYVGPERGTLGWWCQRCWARYAESPAELEHDTACEYGRLLAALAPWADAREEDRDG